MCHCWQCTVPGHQCAKQHPISAKCQKCLWWNPFQKSNKYTITRFMYLKYKHNKWWSIDTLINLLGKLCEIQRIFNRLIEMCIINKWISYFLWKNKNYFNSIFHELSKCPHMYFKPDNLIVTNTNFLLSEWYIWLKTLSRFFYQKQKFVWGRKHISEESVF